MSSNCYLITLIPKTTKRKKLSKKKKLRELRNTEKLRRKNRDTKLRRKFSILLEGPRLHSNYFQDKYWFLDIETTNKGIWHIK